METKGKFKGLAKKVAIGGLVGIASIGLSGRANADMVPADYRANTPDKILALKNYDSVQAGGGINQTYDNLYGNISFENDGPVDEGYRLWFLKKSNAAVVGVHNTTNEDPEGFFRPYGGPSVQNSLVKGDELGVIAQQLSDDSFYEAYFDDSPINFQGNNGAPAIKADIEVTDNIIPEPATLSILATGLVGLSALKRRQRIKRK